MSVDVNELVIIESLPLSEPATGGTLHEWLSADEALTIPLKYIRIQTTAELLNVIGQMRDRARSFGGKWVPVVHLEIHGDAERRGLVMASGEFVPWVRVASHLREVNIIVRNSLVVVLGVCSGAFLLTAAAANPFEPAPFYGVIAPHRPVNSFFLPHGFRAFYGDLFKTGNLVTAVNELRQRTLPEYGGYETAMIFRLGWKVYDRQHLQGPLLAKRLKRIIRKLPPSELAKYSSRNKARAAIAKELRESRNVHDYYRHFIMADVYPENADRFPLDAA